MTFYLPEGKSLWLENKGDCSIQLQGTDPKTVRIGASCTTLDGLSQSLVITPMITNGDDSDFWGFVGLPIVWVCSFEEKSQS